MASPLLRYSNHVADSVSNDFPSNSKQDVLFFYIVYDFSHANWNGLCDNLRDFPWEDMFKFSASAAASELC